MRRELEVSLAREKCREPKCPCFGPIILSEDHSCAQRAGSELGYREVPRVRCDRSQGGHFARREL